MSYCVGDSAFNLDIQEIDTPNSHSIKSKKLSCSEVKLTPFTESDPEMWFALADHTFSVYGIKQDDKKYVMTLQNLDLKYAQMVRDVIMKGGCDYSSLKKELIKQIREKSTKILESEEIGDRTPKEFLSHLKSMVGPVVPESTLQIIWRNRLPGYVRAMLELHPSRNLASEVATAELMNEILSAVAQEKKKNQNVEEIMKRVDSMASEIEQLKRRISELEGCDARERTMKRKRTDSNTEDDVEIPDKISG